MSITAFQPLEDTFSAGLLNWPPPLFTRKSILPNCFSTDDIRPFTCHTGSWNNTVNMDLSYAISAKMPKSQPAEIVCGGGGCTSSSLRMLHGRGVTLAGLDGGIFCLISWAAASSLSVFLLEITTLQPADKEMLIGAIYDSYKKKKESRLLNYYCNVSDCMLLSGLSYGDNKKGMIVNLWEFCKTSFSVFIQQQQTWNEWFKPIRRLLLFCFTL